MEKRARQFLERSTPTASELEQSAKLIEYPFEEVVAPETGHLDHAYYSWAHEENARAFLHWLMRRSL